jgi:hypothetical protein
LALWKSGEKDAEPPSAVGPQGLPALSVVSPAVAQGLQSCQHSKKQSTSHPKDVRLSKMLHKKRNPPPSRVPGNRIKAKSDEQFFMDFLKVKARCRGMHLYSSYLGS